MFVGIFSSFIPYLIAAGFYAVYILVSVIQPLLNDSIHYEYSDEKSKELFTIADSEDSPHFFSNNYHLNPKSVEEGKNYSGNTYCYKLFVKQEFFTHHRFKHYNKFLTTQNSVDILTGLFFRPPPVC